VKHKNEKQPIKAIRTRRQQKEVSKKPPAEHNSAENKLPEYTDTGIGLDILDFQDALPFYVMLVDEEHHILQANNAVRAHLGAEPKDIIGKYCPKMIHGLDVPFDGCPLEEATGNGQVVERDVLDPKTGHWLRSGIYPTKKLTSDGKRIFFHMVLDITDRKRAEEQLRASHEKLRSLSAHLESVREEERKKIARDLHDETSQLLASLSAHLEAAIGTLPQRAIKSKAILKDAQALSVSVIDQLQKLIYELRPLLLDDLGLVSAVGWFVDNSLKASGIKTNFKTTGRKKRLSHQIETTIFRVIQEAISNILRHSHAKNVYLALHFKKGSIEAYVIDDGEGFDVDKAMSSKGGLRGFGLLGMKERTELINGTFNIQSQAGGGTKINIGIPFNNESSNK